MSFLHRLLEQLLKAYFAFISALFLKTCSYLSLLSMRHLSELLLAKHNGLLTDASTLLNFLDPLRIQRSVFLLVKNKFFLVAASTPFHCVLLNLPKSNM